MFAASNLVDPASYEQVARAEQLFFGKPDTTNTFLRRLDLLELGIFGRVRSGSAEKRFDRIADALGLYENNTGGPAASTGRPPGDLTKGFIDHERREAANAAAAGTGVNSPAGNGLPEATDARNNGSSLASESLGFSPERSPAESGADRPQHGEAGKGVDSNAISSATGKTTDKANSTNSTSTSIPTTPTIPRGTGTTGGTRSASKSVATTSNTPVLRKETPKLETGKVASSVPTSSDRRIKRPAPASTGDAVASKGKEVEELFKKGMSEFREKHYGEAQVSFKKILIIDPRNVDAYFNLGSIAETRHDFVDALTYYRAALVTRPTDAELKTAVRSMEEELHKQHTQSAAAGHHQPGSVASAGSLKNDVPKNVSNDSRTVSNDSKTVGTTSHYAPEVQVGSQQAPIVDISSTDAPVVPVQQVGEKAFSLQTAQNGLATPLTPMNAAPAPYQGVPTLGVPQTLGGNIPGNNMISPNAPPTNSTRGTFNSIFSVGAGYALRGSGLHCPICRVLGGLH